MSEKGKKNGRQAAVDKLNHALKAEFKRRTDLARVQALGSMSDSEIMETEDAGRQMVLLEMSESDFLKHRQSLLLLAVDNGERYIETSDRLAADAYFEELQKLHRDCKKSEEGAVTYTALMIRTGTKPDLCKTFIDKIKGDILKMRLEIESSLASSKSLAEATARHNYQRHLAFSNISYEHLSEMTAVGFDWSGPNPSPTGAEKR